MGNNDNDSVMDGDEEGVGGPLGGLMGMQLGRVEARESTSAGLRWGGLGSS